MKQRIVAVRGTTAAWVRNGRSADFTGIWGCFEEKNNMDLTWREVCAIAMGKIQST